MKERSETLAYRLTNICYSKENENKSLDDVVKQLIPIIENELLECKALGKGLAKSEVTNFLLTL